MKCYFDGSEGQDKNGHTWLTLAGYAAPDRFWINFDIEWQAMLRDRYPVAPYIHMIDILDWHDPFERVNGWDETKKDKLIEDAIRLLEEMNRFHFRSFICAIDLTARDNLVEKGHPVSDPFVICAELCVGNPIAWWNDSHPEKPERASVFFDRNERFMHDLRQRWLRERTPPGRVSVNPAWDIIEDIRDVDMRCCPGIQGADMLAWGRSRVLSEMDRRYQDLLPVLRRVVPNYNWDLTEYWMREKNPKTSKDDDLS
jgi:hypothetical protein